MGGEWETVAGAWPHIGGGAPSLAVLHYYNTTSDKIWLHTTPLLVTQVVTSFLQYTALWFNRGMGPKI